MKDREGPGGTHRRYNRQKSEGHSHPWPNCWPLDIASLIYVSGTLNLKEEAPYFSLLGPSPSVWSFQASPLQPLSHRDTNISCETGGDSSLLVTSVLHAHMCSGRMLGLASPLGTLKILEWGKVRHLEGGVGPKQCCEKGGVPLLQPSRLPGGGATRKGAERGIRVRHEEALDFPSGPM